MAVVSFECTLPNSVMPSELVPINNQENTAEAKSDISVFYVDCYAMLVAGRPSAVDGTLSVGMRVRYQS